MNYFFTINPTILKNPLRRGTKYTISAEKSIFFSGSEKVGSIEDFISECKAPVIEYIEIFNLDDHDLEKLLEAIGAKITEATVFHRSGSLSSLSHLTAIRRLDLNSSASEISLWSIKSNTKLDTLTIQLYECTEIKNITELADTSIKDLKIYSGGISLLKPVSVKLLDPAILVSMTALRKAEIHMLPPSDALYALTELSKLSRLSRLSLDKHSFSFAQFAWLKAKLPETSGFGGITEFYPDRQNDTHMMLICGNDVDDLPISEEERIHAEFQRLTLLYEDEPFPPTKGIGQ